MLQLRSYLTIILATLLLVVVGYSYYAHKENVRLIGEVTVFRSAAEDNLKAKEQAVASCEATIGVLSDHYKEQAKLEASQKATGDAILVLPTLTITETPHAAPTKPTTTADDLRLSPATMRLLDAAYCSGDKDNATCTAR